MKDFKNYIEILLKDVSCSEEEKRDLAEEFADHLNMLKQEYLNQGYLEQAAFQKAIKTFGEEHKLGKELQKSLFPLRRLINLSAKLTFIVYVLALFYTLFLERICYNVHEQAYEFISIYVSKTYNFIPFQTIAGYITGFNNYNFDIWFNNTIGNVILFMPLGFLLPFIFNGIKSLKYVVIASAISSLVIEVVQYITWFGRLDVDDVILRTLGGILGFGLFYMPQKYNIFPKKYFSVK